MTTHTSPLSSILAISGDDDLVVLPDLSVGHTFSEALLVRGVEGITCICNAMLPIAWDA